MIDEQYGLEICESDSVLQRDMFLNHYMALIAGVDGFGNFTGLRCYTGATDLQGL